MNGQDIKTLKDLAMAYMEREYMNVPEHCRPQKKFSDSSANELTKSVLAYFKLLGWKAWRQASEGRYIQGKNYKDMFGRNRQEKGMYIPRAKGGKGMGDICVVMRGRFLTIEVKHGKDRQSDVQKETQKEVEDSGGLYMIVKTFDDFIFQISKLTGSTST